MFSCQLVAAIAVAALVCLPAVSAMANVRLPTLIGEGMVLQRGSPVRLWGWADEGEKVSVSFRGQSVSTTATGGKWVVTLKPGKAGGPFALTISGANRMELKDVMVGDVWICSGQSNMQWDLAQANAAAEIPKSTNPMIRLFSVPRVTARRAADDVASTWQACVPETAAHFSAVGYYFGRDLQKALKVPIGLIDSSWGGTSIEPWTSRSYLQSTTDLKDIVKRYREIGPASQWPPGVLYNTMIAPLTRFPIKGVIWYQGESNAPRAEDYCQLLPAMIRNWRADWGVGDFPFLIVQLTAWSPPGYPNDTSWAGIREAQLFASRTLPNVGLAVTIDVGDKDDVHPKNKEPVGRRLALAARGIAYREKVEYSGPMYKSMRAAGGTIILRFRHVGRGLTATGPTLKGFEIAGADGKFAPADAVIKGDTVVVSSQAVPTPVTVRYGWANYPDGNLANKDGLPASPFRTGASAE
ncbi:MAG: sialate O-acetylesterase [Armatimonadota bacterium]|nr:sialate O-acetylesterase [Armatimonadota bacterium]